MSEPYNVSVIGCGSIGALKPDDLDYPGGENILTHAHAIDAFPDFQFGALVDRDEDIAKKAGLKWDCMCASNNLVLEYARSDIAIIAAPTKHHLSALTEVFVHCTPKVVVMEKPCGLNSVECSQIDKLCADRGTKLIVNYSRAYNPHFMALKDALQQEKVLSCTLTYNRGKLREASHFIQLCNMWFGDHLGSYNLSSIYGFPSIDDYSKEDKTECVVMKYELCPMVFMVPIDGYECSLFEIEIITNRHKYLLVNNGDRLIVFPIGDDGIYGHYPAVKWDNKKENETNLVSKGMFYFYEHLRDLMEGTQEVICGADEALRIHNIYEKGII